MNFIFTKRNYKYYITIIGSSTNIFLCIYSLLPPYLLKKPNLYITKINSPIEPNNIYYNHSVDFNDEYCDSSKYIIKKDQINSLHNWAYKYDLYCGKEKDIYSAAIVISLFLGGTLANIVFETFPDKYGRTKIYKILSVFELFLILNLIMDFGIIHIIIIMFFIGINLYIFPLLFVIINEFVVDDLGLIFGIINAFYPLGGILIAFWFMTINDINKLFIVIFISLIIHNYFSFKYLYETPRWLHSQGRKKECLEVLTNVARYNNIEDEWNIYQKNNHEIIELLGSKKDISFEKYGFFQILKIESQKYKFIYSLIDFGLSGVCYFGIVLYLDQMKGNFFINAILTFFGEIVAELSVGFLMDIYGRKKMTVLLMIFGMGFFFFI